MSKKRILIKLSGEAMKGEREFGFDYAMVDHFANEIGELSKTHEVAIVLGAGNIWRYSDNKDSGLDRVQSDTMGMMATLMNANMLSERMKKIGLDTIIYSPPAINVDILAERYNSIKARKSLSEGKIVFCAGGTGSPFFTTDSAAALRAAELNCHTILKATSVDGVYDSDPNKNPDAKKFDEISFKDVIFKGLKVMDQTAFVLSKEAGTDIFIFNMKGKGNFKKADEGDYSIGTHVFNENN
ncbi:UMP kinase [Candidatus Gracilibacteria bacterium]|nr:UMP kinase [Candidatus Gracilibacteria bacterium]